MALVGICLWSLLFIGLGWLIGMIGLPFVGLALIMFGVGTGWKFTDMYFAQRNRESVD